MLFYEGFDHSTIFWSLVFLTRHKYLHFLAWGREDRCGLLDSGLAEIAAGLQDHTGQLEFLTLRNNMRLSQTQTRTTKHQDVLIASSPERSY